jgi:hypothetical protein
MDVLAVIVGAVGFVLILSAIALDALDRPGF